MYIRQQLDSILYSKVINGLLPTTCMAFLYIYIKAWAVLKVEVATFKLFIHFEGKKMVQQ